MLKPEVGQKLYKTFDLETIPFAIQFMIEREKEDFISFAEGIRQQITWNTQLNFSSIVAVHIFRFLKRVLEKLSWWLFRRRKEFEVLQPAHLEEEGEIATRKVG